MSRQIQIRRGTATEHEQFTGAIGEITMDTTNKTLRVHDGETIGGTILAKQNEIQEIINADYIVETQLPTAENNYTWYRKYKSGWVELGGITALSNGGADISFPVAMRDTNYTAFLSPNSNTGPSMGHQAWFGIQHRTSTGMHLHCDGSNSDPEFVCWEIKGFIL